MRLIDANKLPKYTGYALSASDVAIAVENAPTVDAVPVVRCRDCKWRPRNMGEGAYVENLKFPINSDYEEVCPYAAGDPWYNKEPDPDGFCHLGELEVLDIHEGPERMPV